MPNWFSLLAVFFLLAGASRGAEEAPLLGAGAPGEGAPARNGGLLLCTNIRENDPFAPLLASALKILKPKSVLRFPNDDFAGLKARIQGLRPETVVVVAPPKTVDLTFHLQVAAVCLAVDGDPFPDFDFGYVTAASPAEGEAFLRSGARARALRARFPAVLAEVGPGIASRLDPGSPALWCPKLKHRSLLHGEATFLHQNRTHLEGVGILHLFGEGSPWGIESGVESGFLRQSRLRLAPAVVVSGESDLATVDYHYPEGVKAKSQRIGPLDSFCLASVSREPSALLLSLGPGLQDLGLQEIERLVIGAASVGAAVRKGYVDAVLANGEDDPRKLVDPARWEDPKAVPLLSLAFGRALFGDPRFTPFPRPLGPAPIAVKKRKGKEGLEILCVARNPGSFASSFDPFDREKRRERISFSVELSKEESESVRALRLLWIKVGPRHPKTASFRAGLERRDVRDLLHVLVVFDSLGGKGVFSGDDRLEARFRLLK